MSSKGIIKGVGFIILFKILSLAFINFMVSIEYLIFS